MNDLEFERFKQSIAQQQILLLKAIVSGKYGQDSRLMGCLDMLEARIANEGRSLQHELVQSASKEQ